MGVTREDFLRTGRYLEISDEEWELELATRKEVVNNYMKNDIWATKLFKKVAIQLTCSSYGLPFLKASVESFKKLGFWILLTYDNFINPESKELLDYNQYMPPKDIMDNVDSFLLTHHQSWGSVSYPFCHQIFSGSAALSRFEYVLVVNGDCIIEKPDGFEKLLELLGDADILSSGPSLPREIGTAGILMKSSAYVKIAEHMLSGMVPFENYESTTQERGNTEGRLSWAVKELGMKQVICEPASCPSHPICEQFHTVGSGDWFKILGFQHIHGQLNYAYRYKGIPPSYKYLDQRYTSENDYRVAKLYEETKDIKVLEDWWARE